MSALDTLNTFTTDNLPDLDVAVEGALEMLATVKLPSVEVPFERPIVIGSGNAETTGRILFHDKDAVFANESNFEEVIDRAKGVDGAVLISASGQKHSVQIAERLNELDLDAFLFTNNREAPAASFFEEDNVRVFPKNREPYTYNTSTYLSMILAKTKEDPKSILEHVRSLAVPDLATSRAFTFVLAPELAVIAPMLRTKFDELFGARINSRFFTPEEMKHAKTVVPFEQEMFVYVGMETLGWGKDGQRYELPLPEEVGFATAVSTCYHFIGKLQQSHSPYFKANLMSYCEEVGKIFGQTINPIVEWARTFLKK